MLELLKNKENLVFVGGFAMVQHGLKEHYNDIDVVVTDLAGLSGFTEYKTDSLFSKSGKRAFLKDEVDVFIEKELPEYEIINGYKVQTKKSLIAHFEELKNKVKDHWLPKIDANLKLLK